MEEHNKQRIMDLFHPQVGIKKIAEVVGVHKTTVVVPFYSVIRRSISRNFEEYVATALR